VARRAAVTDAAHAQKRPVTRSSRC
jgi:hypothetical protein